MAGRRTSLLALAVASALVLACPRPSLAQTDDGPTTVKSYAFSFDFSAPPSESVELQEVQLHYSIDRGQTWKLYRGVPPSDGKITFEAAGDGEYWFAVQQVYKDGRRRPNRMEGVTPQRKVIVDTTPPRVDLQPVSGGGKVGVEWTIRGDDADLATFRLESRQANKREWTPVSLTPSRTGRKTWDAEGNGDYEVRLHVADRAGNESSPSVFVSLSRPANGRRSDDSDGLAAPPAPNTSGGNRSGPRGSGRLVAEGNAPLTPAKAGAGSSPSTVPIFFVNKLRFRVNYKVDAVGKSGCKAVQLYWRYPDQDEWALYEQESGPNPPYKVAVSGEGKYGIRLRAVSGVGLAEELPQPGAPPQLWVVVDVTPPTVQLDRPKVRFGDPSEVVFSWRASDENPAEAKIHLSYSAVEGPDAGRWKEIAKGLPYEGQHRWKPPADAPYRFNVRIDVEDAAGNVAHDSTTEPVAIDDSRPRAIATAVDVTAESDPPEKSQASPAQNSPEPLSGKRSPSIDLDDLSPAVEVGKKPPSSGPAKSDSPQPPRALPR